MPSSLCTLNLVVLRSSAVILLAAMLSIIASLICASPITLTTALANSVVKLLPVAEPNINVLIPATSPSNMPTFSYLTLSCSMSDFITFSSSIVANFMSASLDLR